MILLFQLLDFSDRRFPEIRLENIAAEEKKYCSRRNIAKRLIGILILKHHTHLSGIHFQCLSLDTFICSANRKIHLEIRASSTETAAPTLPNHNIKLRSSKSSVQLAAVGHVGQKSSARVARSFAAIWQLLLFK